MGDEREAPAITSGLGAFGRSFPIEMNIYNVKLDSASFLLTLKFLDWLCAHLFLSGVFVRVNGGNILSLTAFEHFCRSSATAMLPELTATLIHISSDTTLTSGLEVQSSHSVVQATHSSYLKLVRVNRGLAGFRVGI